MSPREASWVAEALAGPVLVDAHVHFHPCFEEDRFLDGAAAAFRAAARDLDLDGATGVLLFAESTGAYHFLRLARSVASTSTSWHFRATDEECSLIAKRGLDVLILVAGRQIRTCERLEVLALGTAQDFPDGRNFFDTLEAVQDSGALAVIPWGFGKWWFRRGRVVARAISSRRSCGVFMGDNSGRPAIPARPRLFALAEAQHVPILPGSDPLPFPDHEMRVGGCGALLRTSLDVRQPAYDLMRQLRLGEVRPTAYGQRRTLWAFCRDQLRLRLWRLRESPGR